MSLQPVATAREVVDEFGRTWIEVDLARFRMLKDSNPESGMYLLIAAPAGGLGGFAALAEGPPGKSPSIILNSFEELPSSHPTPGTASLTEIVPATDAAGAVYALDLAIRRGAAGEPGAAVITPSDYGTPTAGQFLIVNGAGTGFTLGTPKLGGVHHPAEISSAPSGTTGSPFTVAVVNIAEGTYANDFKLMPQGECRVEGAGSSLRVDFVAHLNAVDGPVIGICRGVGGTSKERLNISGCSGTDDALSVVNGGEGATVFFNTERQSGSLNSYSALNDYISCSVLVTQA
ncbi:hypothetical protein ACORG1_13050 [Mycobacterium sp. TJFP1]